jgi:hypothetical protein
MAEKKITPKVGEKKESEKTAQTRVTRKKTLRKQRKQ